MDQPTVGVVLPCYNEEEWIAGAMRSILAQRYENLVIQIVDDGSNDTTSAIIDEFDDPRIQYTYQENSGHPAALNTGLDSLDTEYYAFLDADDRWDEEKLQLQMKYLHRSDADAVHTNAIHVNEVDDTLGRHHESPPPSPDVRGEFIRELFFDNFICTSSFVCHHSAIDGKRFDEELYANADHDMWLRVAGDNSIGYIDEELLRYRIHAGNMSKDYEKLFQDRRTVAKRAVDRYPNLRKHLDQRLSHIYLTYGVNLILDGEALFGRTIIRESIRYDPTNWKAYGTYILSYGGGRLLRSLAKAGKHYSEG